jgi:hypothetical protein
MFVSFTPEYIFSSDARKAAYGHPWSRNGLSPDESESEHSIVSDVPVLAFIFDLTLRAFNKTDPVRAGRDLGPPERREGGSRHSATADHIHFAAAVEF